MSGLMTWVRDVLNLGPDPESDQVRELAGETDLAVDRMHEQRRGFIRDLDQHPSIQRALRAEPPFAGLERGNKRYFPEAGFVHRDPEDREDGT